MVNLRHLYHGLHAPEGCQNVLYSLIDDDLRVTKSLEGDLWALPNGSA